MVLNVALTGDLVKSQTISERTGVDLQLYTNVYSKMWYIDNVSSTAAQPIRTRTNLVFMLNAQRPTTDGICNVYTANSDTEIKIVPVGDGSYRFQLNSTSNRYLTATDLRVGASVNWQALNSSSSMQKWKIVLLPFPAHPSNFEWLKGSKNGFTFYVAKTDPSNIGVVNVVKQNNGIPAPYCGCNGGFFNTATGNLTSLNIAANGSVPIGPQNAAWKPPVAGTKNSVGYGVIVYVDGDIKAFDDMKMLQDVLDKCPNPTWVQGGAALYLGDANWETNWECGDFDPTNENGRRTALVANVVTKKVYLIAAIGASDKTIADFRSALENYLTKDGEPIANYVGIMLDGGTSTGLRVYQNGERVGPDSGNNRPLCQIIYIRD